MKKFLPFLLSLFAVSAFGQTKLIITGIYDGPLSGGHPKGVELFATDAIADLSIYGIGSANNGGGSGGVEFSFPSMQVASGTFLYICAESAGFNDFFGFPPDFEDSGSMGINGDDAIELFMNGNVVDVFGDINTDGSMEPWDHLDGWAYRNDGTGPDGSTFQLGSWSFSGVDAFDGESLNATAVTPFPIGTYSLNPNPSLRALNDFLTTQQNVAVTGNVLSNDILPDGFNQVSGGADPMNGSFSIMQNGDVTYTPDQDFCGSDEFTYVVCLNADCDTATVSVNVECPINYEPKSIGEVTGVDSAGLPTADEAYVELTGVVHNPNFRPGGLQFALIDSNNDGIMVFSGSDDLGYTVTEGDELTVKGQIGSFRGSLQLYVDEISVNSPDNSLFNPTVVTELNESTENQFVQLKNVSFVNAGDWETGSDFNIMVTDGTNTYSVRVLGHLNIVEPQTTNFDVSGIGSQFDFDSPFLEGYQLFPRSTADFSPLSSSDDLNWSSSIEVFPNPTNDILNISGADGVARITVFNSIGQTINFVENPGNTHSFSTSSFKDGIYFLRFENENNQWVTPFVKN